MLLIILMVYTGLMVIVLKVVCYYTYLLTVNYHICGDERVVYVSTYYLIGLGFICTKNQNKIGF